MSEEQKKSFCVPVQVWELRCAAPVQHECKHYKVGTKGRCLLKGGRRCFSKEAENEFMNEGEENVGQ